MYKIKCHCNKVEIEINQPKLFENLLRCNCSICKKRATIMAIVDENNIKIVKGNENLKLYQFHTNTAKHYFCSECGIYTHHQSRKDIKKYGINVYCVDGIDDIKLENIRESDGKNHPLDK